MANKFVILKTHAKHRFGLYKAGEILDGYKIEDLHFKLDSGLVKQYKGAIKTKEEKKVVRRRTKSK